MERNCDKCIHHTSGMCDSWECKMQTVEDIKREAVEEFAEKVVAELEKEKVLNTCDKSVGFNNGIRKAIEIVRGKE